MISGFRLFSILSVLIFTVTEIISEELLSSLNWPLDIRPALSSSFGESRTSSFHMGIDLKTWGRTGYVVRAVSDGFIERVRTSPWGYGRAVYLRLNDGRLAVYGHLEKFGEFLKDRVVNAQNETGLYSVDLWFHKEEFKVNSGDIIGFTGESGAGPPHLHFELRDKHNSPINPLKNDFSVSDVTSPILKSIAFIPIGWDSRVNGLREQVVAELYWDEIEQIFKTSSSVQIEGKVGVALYVWDTAEAAANKLAPYELELRVDSRLFFSVRYDQATYSLSHQIFLDRIRIETFDGVKDFHALFRSKGNRLPFYTNFNDGFLNTKSSETEFRLLQGEHWLEVSASDVANQSASARIKIIVNSSPTIEYAGLERENGILAVKVLDADDNLVEGTLFEWIGNDWSMVSNRIFETNRPVDWTFPGKNLFWKWEVKDGFGIGDSMTFSSSNQNVSKDSVEVVETCRARWIEWEINTKEPLPVFPKAQIAGRSGEVKQKSRSLYIASFPYKYGESDEVSLSFFSNRFIHKATASQRALIPGKSSQLVFEDGEVLISASQNSVYDTLFPQVRSSILSDPENFKAMSPSFLISPINVPFDDRIKIGIRVDSVQALDPQIGLYGSSNGQRWTLLGNDRIDGYISAQVRKFSLIALLADREKPALDILAPKPGNVIPDTDPIIEVMVRDDQSGIIREEDIAIALNGKNLIVEYDPEGHKAKASMYLPLSDGHHIIEASVKDAAGNENYLRSVFTVGL